MSRKRFSRKGLEKLESNFQIVEVLLDSSMKKEKKMIKEVLDLKDHRASLQNETKEAKASAFYKQRKSLNDRDIARAETQLEILQAERLGYGIYFKKCYRLMYGKPTMDELRELR
jgi:hypothetical protein